MNNYGSVDMDVYTVQDDYETSYEVRIEVDNYNGFDSLDLEMSKTDLIKFRDMIHNLLIKLNQKLDK